MAHFGEIGKRYALTLTLKHDYEFTSYFGYIEQTKHIYTFVDADGIAYVWKTTSNIGMDTEDDRGNWGFDPVRVGDTAEVKATIKAHGTYKDADQTEVTRVKVISISHIPTKEEREDARRAEQLKSIQEGDFVWQMPYRQYKEHYSDCETLAGSFNRHEDSYGRSTGATIDVIIRAGRLVPSGVRGQRFNRYTFEVDGGQCSFRAVSEANAEKQCRKMFPDAKSIECVKIFRSGF